MRRTLAQLALGLMLGLGLAAPAWGQAAAKTKDTAKAKGSPAAKTKAAKVDLNTATADELEELPGVGPARSAAIIKARPFKTVADLKKLDEIPARLYDEIAPRLTVSEPTSTPKKAATRAMTKGGAPKAKATVKEATAVVGKVDLNTATADELQELPSIGPARAEAIIKARPFKAVDDLKKVEDVPARVYNEIEPRLTASAPAIAAKESSPKAMPKATTPKAKAAASAKEAEKEDDPSRLNRKKAALAAGRKINLNSATAEELQELPGIGPVRSAAIIKARPFETIEDVMKVDGIKEGIFGQIKDHISVK